MPETLNEAKTFSTVLNAIHQRYIPMPSSSLPSDPSFHIAKKRFKALSVYYLILSSHESQLTLSKYHLASFFPLFKAGLLVSIVRTKKQTWKVVDIPVFKSLVTPSEWKWFVQTMKPDVGRDINPAVYFSLTKSSQMFLSTEEGVKCKHIFGDNSDSEMKFFYFIMTVYG